MLARSWRRRANVFSSEPEEIEEFLGKLQFNEGLMHSILEDKEATDQGGVIKEAINQGLSSFIPDMMFEKLVKNYSLAERLYGERLLKWISGYDPRYVERNIKIPEFQRELKEKIAGNVDKLTKNGLLDKEGMVTEKGLELASLTLYVEELENLMPKGEFGEKVHKKTNIYGEKQDSRQYKKGDRYRDIALKKSIKTAIRRGHSKLIPEDLKVHERQSKGMTYLVYAMDASGSMKGKKIDVSKKAGVALAYKAIDKKDKVGLIVFGSDIKSKVMPTDNFDTLLKEITKVKASMETDIVGTIKESVQMFPEKEVTKHLILLTDALPTVGESPEEETLAAVANARAAGITTSLIGISLDKKGRELAKKIAEIGEGRLYVVKNLDELDRIVLEDYYEVV